MNLFIMVIWIATLLDISYQKAHKYKAYKVPVKLDHFTFGKTETFDLKFLISKENIPAVQEPPLFLYCGNEGEITLFADNFDFLYNLAEHHGAVLVFVEHRGYGETLTNEKGQMERQHYQYLTMNQVIEDFVYFIDYFNEYDEEGRERSIRLNRPVFLFGASYGGMLAAYTKYKFDHKIAGVIASGATLLDYYGLRPNNAVLKGVTDIVLATEKGNLCKENISRSWDVIGRYVLNEKDWLMENWNLIKEKPIKNEDISVLMKWITSIYVITAVSNYPFETNFLMPLPANPVKEMCKHLGEDDLDDKSLMLAVYKALSVYLNHENKDVEHDWTIGISSRFGTDTWDVQQCIDLIEPIWSDGKTDMFWYPREFNYNDIILKPCESLYGLTPDPRLALRQFGGEKAFFNYENMIFTNSRGDPWYFGSPRKNFYNSQIIFHNYKEAAHMQDFFSPHDDDAEDLQRGRNKIRESIAEWIVKWHKQEQILKMRNFD